MGHGDERLASQHQGPEVSSVRCLQKASGHHILTLTASKQKETPSSFPPAEEH